jgi:hypothetical protein
MAPFARQKDKGQGKIGCALARDPLGDRLVHGTEGGEGSDR